MKTPLIFVLLTASALANAGTCANASLTSYRSIHNANIMKDACKKAVGLSNCRHIRWPAAHKSDCSSFLQYTTIPAATIVIATAEEQSTITVRDTTTVGPETDEATATQPDSTATTSLSPYPETFTVSVTPTKTVTVTVTPDPLSQIEVNFKTLTKFDVSTVTETVYYSNVAKRAINLQATETIIKPTDIPSYAVACVDAGQYSSACVCMGVKETTVTGTGSIVFETVQPLPETVIDVRTENRPAITITTTLPGKTRTITVTLPASQTTETTTADATTVSTSITADQETLTITKETTLVNEVASVTTVTRSVGPICTTYTSPPPSCSCKFEVICDRQVDVDFDTFSNAIDFNIYTGSFEECMQRCNDNSICKFGDFASLPSGGLCSTYSNTPSSTGVSSSGSKYFEKNGNAECTSCSE